MYSQEDSMDIGCVLPEATPLKPVLEYIMVNRLFDIVDTSPDARSLWDGKHKIPWNDPAFSARILVEHLSQEHHLASRKRQFIEAQAAWIHAHVLTEGPATVLDLGCGPGLYSQLVAGDAHAYTGMDFSPASVEYASRTFRQPGRCEFRLGNVVEAEFGGPYDVVMMLYGELNVFSPDHCRRILGRAFDALAPGGRLLAERQRTPAVRAVGQSPNTWTRAGAGGLFSDVPYVCLTENHWFEKDAVALQCFHVLVEGREGFDTYRSTTKAWTGSEMENLLLETGYADVQHHADWPVPDDGLTLVSALKRQNSPRKSRGLSITGRQIAASSPCRKPMKSVTPACWANTQLATHWAKVILRPQT
eukprot:TRINITY_DN11503_c0_g3_i2.p2 TRINITY_DN11503_c0_g3~~TRINITY_DN11503_c0_g3_i2.p2  ORF type:complete len:361 (+),score=51.83 TRINITY_DN11503_c0_g3_i2:1886-2968(+)